VLSNKQSSYLTLLQSASGLLVSSLPPQISPPFPTLQTAAQVCTTAKPSVHFRSGAPRSREGHSLLSLALGAPHFLAATEPIKGLLSVVSRYVILSEAGRADMSLTAPRPFSLGPCRSQTLDTETALVLLPNTLGLGTSISRLLDLGRHAALLSSQISR
jgi:hypothetical protein